MKALPYSSVPAYKTYLYSPEFSQAALDTLGEIDVDPCAGPSGQFIQAKRCWTGLTTKTDGYSKPWPGNVFFNCDNYERPLKNKLTGELVECPHQFHKMSEWATKLLFELEYKRTKQAIGFFPCRMFKPWAHSLILPKASALCYHTRKISFYICELKENGYETRTAKYNNVGDGYVTALFSDSPETICNFAKSYKDHGTVVRNQLLTDAV